MKSNKKDGKFGLALALGSALGTAIGVETDNLAVWIPIGIAVGFVFGKAMVRKHTNRNDDTP